MFGFDDPEYLDAEVKRLLKENEDLRAQIARLRRRLRGIQDSAKCPRCGQTRCRCSR